MTLFGTALLEANASAPRCTAATSSISDQSGLPFSLDDDVALTASPTALGLKRLMDVIGAVAGLLLLMPALIVVAVAIKATSPGPVLLRQVREGFRGRLFTMYKFRTMYSDQCDATGTVQVKGSDMRVTPVGRLLRRTSLDELPQLLNVLLGQISLVGPRPHVPDMLAAGVPYRQLVPAYRQRLSVRPGLTGWAQANGLRGPTSDDHRAIARVYHDLAYIQNWSLALDCRIIAQTLIRELTFTSGS